MVDQLLRLNRSAYYFPEIHTQTIDDWIYHGTIGREKIYKKNDKYVIVIPGTDNVDDLTTNIVATIRGIKNTKKYQNIKNNIEKYITENNLDKNDFIITGHSLGGAISHNLAHELNIPSITFNPAIFPDTSEINNFHQMIMVGNRDFITKPLSYIYNRPDIRENIKSYEGSHTLEDVSIE
jgi:FixJ family two-component response regulator